MLKVLFNLQPFLPATNCDGWILEKFVYPPQAELWNDTLAILPDSRDGKVFQALQVLASRQCWTLKVLGRAGNPMAIECMEPQWIAAWDRLELGDRCFEGTGAIKIMDLVHEKIASGGMKKRGGRGKQVKGAEPSRIRENFVATVVTNKFRSGNLLSAARLALAQSQANDTMPNRYGDKIKEVEADSDLKGRKVGMREIEKDAANAARDAEKAANKARNA